jgi:hypothetical protein
VGAPSSPDRPSAASDPGAVSSGPPRPALDAEGRYHDGAMISYAVVGAYAVLVLLLLFVVVPRAAFSYLWVPYALVAVLLFYLVRYLTTRYTIDDVYLRARRIAGPRKVLLEEVRRIEYASLRDLGGAGFAAMGAWGWRGRTWSPTIGTFDSVYTDPAHGLLVTAGDTPLYISPRHTEEFARELSRRVRSYTGPLPVDVGFPGSTAQ